MVSWHVSRSVDKKYKHLNLVDRFREYSQEAVKAGKVDKDVVCFLKRLNRIRGVGVVFACIGHGQEKKEAPYLTCIIRRPPDRVFKSLFPNIEQSFYRVGKERVVIEYKMSYAHDAYGIRWTFRYAKSTPAWSRTVPHFTKEARIAFFQKLTNVFESCLTYNKGKRWGTFKVK